MPADETQPETEVVHHVSARKKRARKPVTMQPNLAAMIDVIFLLLIYFVVTANFTFDEGVLSAKLPQGAGAPRAPDLKLKPIELNIVLRSVDTAGVRISINEVEFADNFTELYGLLAGMRSRYDFTDDNPVIIKPDGRVRWQHVVNAFNAAVRAKYTNVSFATVE